MIGRYGGNSEKNITRNNGAKVERGKGKCKDAKLNKQDESMKQSRNGR